MKTITEKELQSAAETPGNGWFIIEAAGDHPHTYPDDDGKELEFMLHVPTEALEAVAAAGVPGEGLLVDKDHLSHDLDKSTEAYGWVKELAMCEGNLAARIEWTPLGLPLVAGKVYKHFSTEYSFNLEDARQGSVTPGELTGLALTNRPCNKVGQPAISSREGGAPLNPGQGGQGDEKKQQEPNKAMNAQILEALGLSETATDEEVLQAINDLKAAASSAEEAEVETMVCAEEAANDIQLTEEEKKEVIEELLTNREHGKRYLTLLCRDKAAQKNPQRKYGDGSKRATTTAAKPADKHADENRLISRAGELCNEARRAGKRLSFRVAFAQAKRENVK